MIAYSVMMHSVSQVFGRMFQIFLMFGQKCCTLDLVDSFRAIQQTLHIYMTGMLPQKGDFFFFKEQVKTVMFYAQLYQGNFKKRMEKEGKEKRKEK